jgi:sugar lactone lactonase YvrE
MNTIRRLGAGLILLAALVMPAVPQADAQSLYVGYSDAPGDNDIIDSYALSGGVLSTSGALFTTMGASTIHSVPGALAFDSQGDLYAVSQGSALYRYAFSGGHLSSTPTVIGGGVSSQLSEARGLAFDSAGDLFVANFGYESILEYKNIAGALSGTGTTLAFTSGSPTGLAFDSAGNLFVSTTNRQIIEYPFRNGTLSSAGTVFADSSQGLTSPGALAFDSKGDLYVANVDFSLAGNAQGSTIVRFLSSGGSLSGTGAFFAYGLGGPDAMAFDSAGDLFVAYYGGFGQAGVDAVEKFASIGGTLSTNGTALPNLPGTPNGLAISPDSPTSSHSWTAVSTSTGADGFTRLLWTRTDGTASVWKVNSAGSFSQVQYGPYAGWTAKAIATGSDNQTRLLWTNTSGAAAFYLLDSNNAFVSQTQYGPYAGWTAQGLAAEPDGTTRALWTNANGTATVWTLNASNQLTTQAQFGPYSGWTARAITTSPDGSERMLWDNSNGTATFWRLNSGSQFLDQQQYGPYSGYTATAIASAPDGTGRVVWLGSDAHISLWTINSANVYTGQQYQLGPYSGFSFTGISVGSDGNARLLWDNVSGQEALWSLTPSGGFASNYQFGPY